MDDERKGDQIVAEVQVNCAQTCPCAWIWAPVPRLARCRMRHGWQIVGGVGQQRTWSENAARCRTLLRPHPLPP